MKPTSAIINYFLHHDTIVSVRYVIMFCTLFTLTFSLLSSKIYDYSFFFHADSTNRVFNVTIDTGSRSPVVTFQFLNGPVTSATCTIQYGTDPAYVYLPNIDSFNGTNVNHMTVVFSAPLQTETLYYCLVSSMGVQMQGTFRLGIDKHIWFFYSSSCTYHISLYHRYIIGT